MVHYKNKYKDCLQEVAKHAANESLNDDLTKQNLTIWLKLIKIE
jgi:hypothetical protein